jgi:hypothetical protein
MKMSSASFPLKNSARVSASLCFGGRIFSLQELELMREIAKNYAGLAVTEMARTLCELLDWKRPTGRLKDLECRKLLEHLQAQGWLQLPPVRRLGRRGPRQIQLTDASAPQATVEGTAGQFEPLELRVVESQDESRLWMELIERHHYLKYRVPVGGNLRYLVQCGQRGGLVLACLLWSSPAWKMAARDEWIGWNAEQRARQLQFIVNNSRFLVLPWVHIKGLASKILAAERTSAADRLGTSLWLSTIVAGNIGGCTALPWDLLSRSELDPSRTNFGARSHGPGAQSSSPRDQGYLPLPAEAQRAAAPLGSLRPRRTYYVGENSAVPPEIYQLKVTLLDTNPPIWRRLLVPSELTLAQLHDVLQVAMGWQDGHLHQFSARGRRFGPPDPADQFMADDLEDERRLRVFSLFGRTGAKAVYTYDFGDTWEHSIVLEKRLPAAPNIPQYFPSNL